jgi:hypothetical protein
MRNAKRGGRYVKKFLTLALMAFLVVSSTGFVLAQDPLPTPIVVAWDVSIGAQTSDHTTLIANLVQDNKFEVTTVDIKTDGIPADIDMLVITTKANGSCLSQYPGYWDPDVPDEQGWHFVDLIRDAVESEGLGLFLLNEGGSTCGMRTAEIANRLEANYTWTRMDTYDQLTFVAGSQYQPDLPSALFNGVDSWREYHAGRYDTNNGVVVTTDPNQTINPYPAMIAKPFGDGCTVITGDSDWIQDGFIGDLDNKTLANNVFRYLEHCGPWDNPGRLVRGRGNIYSPSATAGAPPPGEASFVLVAKYSKDVFGGQVSLEIADWEFVSDSDSFHGWLTAGNKASFEGTGRFDGAGPSYPFKIWAGDGTAGGEDSFRIRIPHADPLYDYDNCPDCEDPYNVGISKGRVAIQGKE